MKESVERFSRVAAHYHQYRPRYPEALAGLMAAECGLAPEHVVADIGSGTGLLAKNFVENGNQVYAVEPNAEMRAAAENIFAGNSKFISIAGAAEATGLGDTSVDFAAAGQAFHWFDRPKARVEFERILRPGGWVVLVWNLGRNTGSPFDTALSKVLKAYTGLQTAQTGKRKRPAYIDAFFETGHMREFRLDNHQDCDLDGLKGRVLSASSAPAPDDPQHQPLMAALDDIFESHQVKGQVRLAYDTQVVTGRLEV